MKKAFDANIPRAKVRYRMKFPPDFLSRPKKNDSATLAISRLATESRDPNSPAAAPVSQNPIASSMPVPGLNIAAALAAEALQALSQEKVGPLVRSGHEREIGKKVALDAGMSDKVMVPQHSPGTTSPSRRVTPERKSVLPEIPEPSDAYSQVESDPSASEQPEPMDPVAEMQANAIERISVLEHELAKLKTLDLSLEGPVQAARHQAERASDDALTRMEEARRISLEMEEKARVLTDLTRELATLQGQKDQALIALEESHRTLVESLADEESTAKELAEILDGIRRLTSIIARLASLPSSAPLPSGQTREDPDLEPEDRSPSQ